MNGRTTEHMMLKGLRRLTDDVTTDESAQPDSCFARTAIASLNGRVTYRGFAVDDLVRESTFAETACLLLRGELPDCEVLADFHSTILELSELDPALVDWLEGIPLHVGMMDMLRTAISMLAHFDPQRHDATPDIPFDTAQRLLARVPLLIAARTRVLAGQPPTPIDPHATYAASVFQLLAGRAPTRLQERAFDAFLIANAEDGLSAPALASRIIGSSSADVYSAFIAAVSAVAAEYGERDIGARVMSLLRIAGRSERPERLVCDLLMKDHGIMGFRRASDAPSDPRVTGLTRLCRRLAAEAGLQKIELAAERFEDTVFAESGYVPELVWPSVRLLSYCRLGPEFFGPLVCLARIPSWASHAIEQSRAGQWADTQFQYVGPDERRFVPVDQRF